MTCASCANRIERRLNKLDGVTATVNYATEKATVEFDAAAVEPEALVGGRRGRRLPRRAAARREPAADERRRGRDRRDRAAAPPAARSACALALPVLLLSMIPPLQFDNWQWLALQLATPVVVWGAWPFHRAAWVNLRHGAATMDTLISLGVLAAFGCGRCTRCSSATPAMTGMTMRVRADPGGARRRRASTSRSPRS